MQFLGGPLGAAGADKNPGERPSNLFAEVNNLRHGAPEVDQEALEKAKLNNTIFGKLAGSKKFEYTTLFVIVLNAGFIGYDADFSARKEKPKDLYDCKGFEPADCYQFIVMENLFAVYFTFEVVVRFFAYKQKSMILEPDWWFLFDGTLVAFMVLETWVLPIVGASGPLAQLSVLRLLRLLRITRMAKLMRFFPELQIIVKGMVAAVRSVLCTGLLLILILYVWAILFTSEFHQGDAPDAEVEGSAQGLFGSMGKSMRHLFIMGTILDDITLCCNSIRGSNKGPAMLSAFIVFVLISSFTMLNMLIGILCEVVCATGEGERNKNTEMHVRDAITNLFATMDEDGNGEINRTEFMSMKGNKEVMKALDELEVKAKHFEMYADLMFKPSETLEEGEAETTFDFEKTINMIMRLRPGTKVSALDFANFQMTVYKNHDRLKNHIATIEKMTTMLTGKDPIADSSPPTTLMPSKQAINDEQKISMSTLPELGKSSDQDILAELQRRLGIVSVGRIAVQQESPAQLEPPSKIVEAFETHLPGLSDNQAWSKETYTC